MRALVIGAAGMVGGRLAASLAADPEPGIEALTLVDVVEPAAPAGAVPVSTGVLDLTDAAAVAAAVAGRPGVIVHLAAIVSGEAEADFEKGYAVNFDGTRRLLEAIRAEPDYRPRVIFASSIAVYGAPFPETIPEEFHLTPLTSYGTQKAMSELLLADHTRRGFLDGIGLRLPTICIRPGAPNKAASGFFSNILREPLAGREAVLPVDDTVRHWHASPRAAVGFFRHAMRLDLERLGARRSLAMPGLSATVAEQIEALRRAAGDEAVRLIRREPDPVIRKIVAGWATRLDASRALALGFAADASFDAIVAAHVEDELGGRIAL
ncbi:MAG TPA: D-erythronate dehydrogenase [Amaricoccus sp.]|nr:D-erythronate dehydrogenase [Amaricoccus sp.]